MQAGVLCVSVRFFFFFVGKTTPPSFLLPDTTLREEEKKGEREGVSLSHSGKKK